MKTAAVKTAETMTTAQLTDFVNRRNTSEFQSNLQFQIDANAAGINVDDLGKALKGDDGAYRWLLPTGEELIERNGKMTLYRDGKVIAGIKWIEPHGRADRR